MNPIAYLAQRLLEATLALTREEDPLDFDLERQPIIPQNQPSFLEPLLRLALQKVQSTQPSWSESSSLKGQQKMSLLAFLFFLMGALHIYAHLQRQKHWLNSEARSLLKVSLLAAIVAGLIEILVL